MIKMKNAQLKTKSSGFTILELLIATMVFSVILLVITSGILQIGHTYYKGALQSRTQETARNIIDEITRGIQFSGDEVVGRIPCGGFCPYPANTAYPITDARYGMCIGGRAYSYILDKQRTVQGTEADNDNGRYIFTSYDPGGSQRCNGYGAGLNSVVGPSQPYIGMGSVGLPLAENVKEFLPVGMRLLELDVQQVGSSNAYQVTVVVAAGERDFFNPDPGPTPYSPATPVSTSCKSGSGSQYCAISKLSTTVQKRVN